MRTCRPWVGAVALALVSGLGACDPQPDPGSRVEGPRATVATIPNPVIDPAAQKLDAGLAPAYKALKAGQFGAAREAVTSYVCDRGAAARRGQAEFVIGQTYHRQMLYAEASEHFLRALELEPGFVETYYYAGLALFNIGRLTEARAALAVYARQNSNDAATAFGQGLVELEDDRVDEAERFIRRAIELATAQRSASKDPREIDADIGRYSARLGDVYMRRDDVTRAREMFAKATALRPDSPEIWSKLANACERLGDADGASLARQRYDETLARRAAAGGKNR